MTQCKFKTKTIRVTYQTFLEKRQIENVKALSEANMSITNVCVLSSVASKLFYKSHKALSWTTLFCCTSFKTNKIYIKNQTCSHVYFSSNDGLYQKLI